MQRAGMKPLAAEESIDVTAWITRQFLKLFLQFVYPVILGIN